MSQRRSIVYRKKPPFPAALIEACKSASVPALVDAAEKSILMAHEIKSRLPGSRAIGPAVTCRCEGDENLTVHRALSYVNRGDILVVETGAGRKTAAWGGLMSKEARQLGLSGVIVDGPVRDVIQIQAHGFPVFSRSILPRGPTKGGFGSVNIPVRCGGQLVYPADLVVADDDGIVVIPRLEAEAIVSRAVDHVKREASVIRELEEGKSLFDLMDMEGAYEDFGVTELDDEWEATIPE